MNDVGSAGVLDRSRAAIAAAVVDQPVSELIVVVDRRVDLVPVIGEEPIVALCGKEPVERHVVAQFEQGHSIPDGVSRLDPVAVAPDEAVDLHVVPVGRC